jgi:hypothetical protein
MEIAMSISNDVLNGLTVDQATAAALSGAVLVLAGAGTGKTKTLTAGVAHRITTRRIPASRILAVTFTNKSAAEMLARIRAGVGDGGAPSWIGTFHGLGARQLRIEPEVAGLRPSVRGCVKTQDRTCAAEYFTIVASHRRDGVRADKGCGTFVAVSFAQLSLIRVITQPGTAVDVERAEQGAE